MTSINWRTRPRWFWFYFGPDEYFAVWRRIVIGFLGRRDLMTQPGDEGALVLAAFSFECSFGPTWESMEDRRWRWVWWPRFRSDITEIARRLAGGDE